jgi:hypothetical protein
VLCIYFRLICFLKILCPDFEHSHALAADPVVFDTSIGLVIRKKQQEKNFDDTGAITADHDCVQGFLREVVHGQRDSLRKGKDFFALMTSFPHGPRLSDFKGLNHSDLCLFLCSKDR